MKKIITKENLTSKYSTELSNLEDTYPMIASAMRSVLGIFPFGTFITEFSVDSLARKKQSRLNRFLTYFGEFLELYTKNGKVFQDFNKDEFEDIFESLLLRVHRTRTENKRKIFAKILADSLCFEKNNFDFIETFLDLVDRLNTKQLEILDYYLSIKNQKTPIYERLDEIQNEIKNSGLSPEEFEILKLEKLKLDKRLQEIHQTTLTQTFEIDNTSLSYYKQDLVSKSLLKDFGLNTFDATPYIYLELTEFGHEFLIYIKG